MPLALPPPKPSDAPTDATLPQFRMVVRYGGSKFVTIGTVVSGQTQRGRTSIADTTVPGGTATLTVDDTAGLLDPSNTSSPLYGHLDADVTGVSVYLDVWLPALGSWQPIFTGRFQDISRSWPGGGAYSETSVQLADGVPDLSDHVYPKDTAFPAQQVGARILALAAGTSRSGYTWQTRAATGGIGVDPGSKVLGPMFCDGTTSTWAYMSAAAYAERGQLFFDPAGVLVYHGFERRLRAGAGSAALTFGDAATAEVNVTPDLAYRLTRNQVTRDIGIATVDQVTSVYGSNGLTAVHNETTGITLQAGEVAQLATVETSALADQWQGASLAQYSWRRFRNSRRLVESVKVDAAAAYPLWTTASEFYAAANIDISNVVTVTRRPSGGGSTLTGQWFAESVAHDFSPDHWDVSYVVSPVYDTSVMWQLGTSRLGTSSTSPARLSW